VIAQGVVPRLLQLVGDNMMPTQIKLEATITLGSLAKGTEDHIKALVDLGVVPVLINGKFHKKICLCVCADMHTQKPCHQEMWKWIYSFFHS
jgi:hypothetical protein